MITENKIKEVITKLKEKESLCSIALDIGVSESSLYKFMNDYGKIRSKTLDKIQSYVLTQILYKPIFKDSTKEMNYTTKRSTIILAKGYCSGYAFVIASYGSHPCSYIKIPKGHELFIKENIDGLISCHGGVTYKAPKFPNEIKFDVESEGLVIGWDYAHYLDFISDRPWDNLSKRWTTEELIKEVIDVAYQLDVFKTMSYS